MINREKMLIVGQMVSRILNEVGSIIKPGISTEEIDVYGAQLIKHYGARSGALGYHGFPKSLCTSVNDVVCHGIPSGTKLISGDFVNVDIAIEYDGYYGDTSRCFLVGKVDQKTRALISNTYEAMWKAIEICGPGVRLNEIGKVIENHIIPNGYSVVRQFCGHGIGTSMHMEPNVPHYFEPKNNFVLEQGMAITIEPMINGSKNYKCRVLNDGWTARTVDGAMSAQWEHTIYITDNGYEVTTFNEYDRMQGKNSIKII